MKKQILCVAVLLVLLVSGYSQTVHFNGQVFKIDTLYPKQAVAGNWNGLSFPWELTYGPDDSLWVTEAHGYRIWKINPGDKGARMLLDLNSLKDFNYYTTSPGPQGGLEGMAFHPLFTSGKPYVYIVLVYHKNLNSGDPSGNNNNLCSGSTGNHPCYFTSKVMRYTYDFATHTLGSPTVMLDDLPGSNDHNSGRLKVSPVGAEADGNYYLYYSIGDMGAGQFNNQTRTNNAQNKDVYEGKILRLNTESDGDAFNAADPFNDWIPNSNPYTNSVTGFRTAVFSYGHRNCQGLVWAHIGSKWILYNSEHGDKSDDEVNIIQAGNNYGWPKVAGLCDDNYNTFDANPNNDLLANQTVPSETGWCNANTNTEPMFSFFNAPGLSIPSSSTSNYTWPTIAPSSIDYYDAFSIPGWNNSLLVTSLKMGMFRLKLKPAGDFVDSTSTPQIVDTIPYLHQYRIRDIAISPAGDTLFLAIDSSGSTSGPTGGFTGATTPTPTPGFILRMVYLTTLPLMDNLNNPQAVANRTYVKVYPNPVSNLMYVISKRGMHKPLKSLIYDITGKLVLQQIDENDNFSINIRSLKPGMYFFKLYNGYDVLMTTEKIVVQ